MGRSIIIRGLFWTVGGSCRFKDALAMRFYNAAGADVKPTPNPVTEAGVIVMNWDQASDLSPYMVSMSCEVGGACD
jgi:hypothetical protein